MKTKLFSLITGILIFALCIGPSCIASGDRVWIEDVSGEIGQVIAVNLMLENEFTEVDVFTIYLNFDSEMLEYFYCEPGDLDPDWYMFACNSPAPNRLTTGGFTIDPSIPTGSYGCLVTIYFIVTCNSCEINDTSLLHFYEIHDDISHFETVDGTFTFSGEDTPTPGNTATPTPTPVPVMDRIWVEDVSGAIGEQIAVNIMMENDFTPVSAFTFTIGFDPAMLDFSHCEPGELDPGWYLFGYNPPGPDTVTISGFSILGIQVPSGSSGHFATLYFNVTCSSCELNDTSDIRIDDLQDDIAYFESFNGLFTFMGAPGPTSTPTPVLTSTPTPVSETIHVPSDYPCIQDAVNASAHGDTILVADGTYSGFGNIEIELLGKRVHVISENGPYYCVIDGDGGVDQMRGRGFYLHQDETHETVIEGFTIRNGQASSGGAIVCYNSSPTIKNCLILNNKANCDGGGLLGMNTNVHLIHCQFIGNNADMSYGGAVFIASDVILSNCLFADNTAGEGNGGGVGFGASTHGIMENCTVINNSADDRGGGISCWSSNLTVSDSIFWMNNALDGPELCLRFQSEMVLDYSDIRGGTLYADIDHTSTIHWGEGLIESDPMFVYGLIGGYYLSQTAAGQGTDSPCLNTGSQPATDICFTDPDGEICLDELTTRTDQVFDTDTADIGFHYLFTDIILPSPTPTATTVVTPSPTSTIPPITNTYYVPGDFSTIQAAINGSGCGDTVMISDGTYSGTGNTNIQFNGVPITVRSVNGPANCLIDCQGTSQGFLFNHSETGQTVLSGLTIINGHGVSGGGIACFNSSPTITNCIIRDCIADENGGGIYCENSQATVEDCVLMYNTALWGGGIECTNASLNIINCEIHHNTATIDGGGIETYSDSKLWIFSCTITENQAMGNGGGIVCIEAQSLIESCTITGNTARWGGGIECTSASPLLLSCDISNNTATEDGGGIECYLYSFPKIVQCTITSNSAVENGGGLYCVDYASPSIFNCLFSDNTADFGGAAECSQSNSSFMNCLFSGNNADINGAAIQSNLGSGITVYSSTFTQNSGPAESGGVHATMLSSFDFKNCIFWNNSDHEITTQNSDVLIEYSCIQDGFPGEGNITSDPLFSDGPLGIFYLSQIAAGQSLDSPCRDTGDHPASEYCYCPMDLETCLSERTTRTDHINDLLTVDMGFHYPDDIILPTPTPSPVFTPPNPYPLSQLATPTPIWTPTATPGTQPTPSCDSTGVILEMPSHAFQTGNLCYLSAWVCNAGIETLIDYPLFVILDVYGSYWFGPSWKPADQGIDFYLQEFEPGLTEVVIIPEFLWPEIKGSGSGIVFWGAMTDPSHSELFGTFSNWTFGWN